MAKQPRTVLALAPAQALADRLRTALIDDPDFAPDDLPQETGGAVAPGAMFHVTHRDGTRLRIRVIVT